MWKMIRDKMILNRKSRKPDKRDYLIEELYMQTKTALLEAQNSNFSANNDVILEDTFGEKPNCEYEENVSVSLKSDLSAINSSNFLNSSLSSELDTETPTEHVNETELLSHTEGQSKVVVQVLPKVEFGDKFDLLESGISHKTAGFTPSTFQPTAFQPMSHLISQKSDVEEFSFSDEDSVKNEDDLLKASGVFTNDDTVSPYLSETHLQKFKSDKKFESPPHRECMQINSGNANHNKERIDPTREAHQSFCGDFLIYPGDGMKLGDIEYISSELTNASAPVVRILHYILYGSYGLTGNDTLLSQTRQNILLFSGFNFSEQSEVYQKKRNSLLNLPYPLLAHIYNLLVNDAPQTRLDSVEALLNFLKKPSGELRVEKSTEEHVTSETEELKKRALEARPIVLLKRLKENYIEQMVDKKWDYFKYEDHKTEKYNKPAFIRNCSSVQLKHFPQIVNNIQSARRRIINLLHSLLFGRPGSEINNRKNILEFSGFTIRQNGFVERRVAFLNRLKLKELNQLCDVFTLRAKSGNKSKKIKKLLGFLRTPGTYLNKTEKMKHTLQLQKAKRILRTLKESREPSKEISLNRDPVHQNVDECVVGASNVLEVNERKIKLRDFENISSNVECATAEDLAELNDLLFVKPCDISEIHQKILDFTPFTFNMNSFDFHYRRTLMHYMNLKTVRKIAQMLDIERWENCTSHQDLALSILKFLMDMKLPEKKRKSASDLKNRKPRPYIMKLQSCNNDRVFSKSRSRTPETFDSTYASEEINDNEYEWGVPKHIYYKEKTPYSKCRHRRNGLSLKHESILNDSTPLLDFIQHPTDRELVIQIDKIINSTSLAMTMGDLVKEVLNSYPNFHLHYRIDFIKTKVLEILQELRQSATIFPD